MEIVFDIDYPGEMAAGLRPFTDTVTIEIESGNPGGETGEFAEYMKAALSEWYDGAFVEIRTRTCLCGQGGENAS